MAIYLIDMAVNPDHVHLFIKYPPKYSVSFIAKKIKGSTSRILRQEFPHLKDGAEVISGHQAVTMVLSVVAGMLSKGIFQLIIHTNMTGNNPVCF